MGFFGSNLGKGLVTAISPLAGAGLWAAGAAGGRNPALPYDTSAPVTASGVGLDSNLAQSLGQQAQGSQNSLNQVYNRIRSRYAKDVGPNPSGGYADQRLAQAQKLSNLGLRGNLESVLGGAGYGTYKINREAEQNRNLAQYIGDLNKPSILQEVLGGLSGASQTGGQFAGLYSSLGKRKPGYVPQETPNYDYYGTGGSGLNLYGY